MEEIHKYVDTLLLGGVFIRMGGIQMALKRLNLECAILRDHLNKLSNRVRRLEDEFERPA